MGPEPAAYTHRWSAQTSTKSTGHRAGRHERHLPASKFDDHAAHPAAEAATSTKPADSAGAPSRVRPNRPTRARPDPPLPGTEATESRCGVGPRARLRQVPRPHAWPGSRLRAVLYRLARQHDHPRPRPRSQRPGHPGGARPPRCVSAREAVTGSSGPLRLISGPGSENPIASRSIDREAIPDGRMNPR
jgi:hypothetical protein